MKRQKTWKTQITGITKKEMKKIWERNTVQRTIDKTSLCE